LLALLPAEAQLGVCARVFRDLRPTARAEFQLARDGKRSSAGSWDAALIQWLLFAPSPDESGMIDANAIPAFEKVQAHWGREAVSVEAFEGGWSLHGRIHKPEAN
jgi:hypothetical protein